MFAEGGGRRRREAPNALAELPLFGAPMTDDVPLITKASPPRPPLAVRRATPEVPRLRAEPRAPMLDWAEPAAPTPTMLPKIELHSSDLEAASTAPRRTAAVPAEPAAAVSLADGEPAPLSARALASVVDMVLLLVIDLLVVYFTLKICRVPLSEFAVIPKAPLLTFLLLQNGGYFVAFTATGQTLGKMLCGVRVLADDEENAPDVGRSALRAGVWLLLALPAGLGLLTTFLMRDGRGLHDRFAGTRVVRAGA
ncbi:MAG: RDD family protein [Vicinamibacterales bacterium]